MQLNNKTFYSEFVDLDVTRYRSQMLATQGPPKNLKSFPIQIGLAHKIRIASAHWATILEPP